MAQRSVNKTWVIISAVLLLVIVTLVLVLRHPKEPTLPTVQTIEDVLEKKREVSTYTYLTPSEWDQTAFAEKAINESQGKDDGQEKIEFGIVQNPDQPTQYYFATSERVSDTELFLGIYQYDSATRVWERLYKKTVTITTPIDVYAFHVLGLHNGSLIVQRNQSSYSPGPCYDPLLSLGTKIQTPEGEREAVSPLLELNLEDPYGQWEQHTLPDTIRTKQEEASVTCATELQ
ncbi:hypothetical protein COV06_03500 [Candidatus Uhrbacteria bacterium CG10_big_fil_rev_8_21_14_0_10_50_16]|uniref:Uncharacterized protein n=1 Tax=Candidatus Uhrbacteria bacterium CG10_big_fil_rev_8_21_14_0_10_50_16 TaxID=1975039 RepID=A0A2H0RLR8_9BACT|nr:MAG: hypothetical protein COV06_03500 [Candidatus Uhrbacteria bacterium CG10_big_fil_rev_8_21_14_0_10_50_16]